MKSRRLLLVASVLVVAWVAASTTVLKAQSAFGDLGGGTAFLVYQDDFEVTGC